jgi:hypothetical protein
MKSIMPTVPNAPVAAQKVADPPARSNRLRRRFLIADAKYRSAMSVSIALAAISTFIAYSF